jgi:murein L,D-transpeptidase YafK
VRKRFQEAGLPYPPREIFLRAFKHEGELELWAREKDDAFRLITSYRVTARSGGPGPKRREGDRQVPEGCYIINAFNPKSRFHLSLGLDYPNAADRVLADPDRPGGEIYIHGSDRTIGCLPLGNAAIEELYLTALDTRAHGQTTIHVHIFPARMAGPSWTEFAERETRRRPALRTFWDDLQPIYDAFERTRLRPETSVTPEGRYRIVPFGNSKLPEPNSK